MNRLILKVNSSRFAIVAMLLFFQQAVNAQSESTTKNCSNSYCTVLQNAKTALLDSQGDTLIGFKYQQIYFSKIDTLFKVYGDNGWGVVSASNRVILQPTYRFNMEIGSKVIIATKDGIKYGMFSTRGDALLNEEYRQINKYAYSPTSVWALKDSTWLLFNSNGKLLSELRFVEFSLSELDADTYEVIWMCKTSGGSAAFVKIKDGRAELEVYQSIEEVPTSSSATILTHLPNEKGLINKQLFLRYGRFKSEVMYKEICFEPACLKEFKDAIPYDEITKRRFKAIGILHNNNVHLFKYDGEIEEISH